MATIEVGKSETPGKMGSSDDAEAGTSDLGFKRTLGAWDLTMIGVGSIIGSGIFVMSGQAAALYAGPAIVL